MMVFFRTRLRKILIWQTVLRRESPAIKWNLIPRTIKVCRIQWWCSLLWFSFLNKFWTNFIQKIKIVRLKFGTYIYQSSTKCLRPTLFFMWNSALWEMFNFCFSRVFLLVLIKFSFWQEGWTLGYHSMNFRHFPDIS